MKIKKTRTGEGKGKHINKKSLKRKKKMERFETDNEVKR